MFEDPEADSGECEVVPGINDRRMAIVADPHTSKPFDPADRAFDHPANLSQMAPVWCAAAANHWLDAHGQQEFPRDIAVIAGVGKQSQRMEARTAGCATDLWEPGHGRENLAMVTDIRSCGLHCQRCSAGIDQNRVFRAGFSAIDRTGATPVATAKRSHLGRGR